MTRDHQHNPDVSLKCGIRSVRTGTSIRGQLGKPRANLREGLLALLLPQSVQFASRGFQHLNVQAALHLLGSEFGLCFPIGLSLAF